MACNIYLHLNIQIWHTLLFKSSHNPSSPVISALGQEFKSALTWIDWYSYSLLFVTHLEMATARAKSKGTQLEHLQRKQDTRGFGTVSPIIQRASRNTPGWEAQLQISSATEPRLSYHHPLTTTEQTVGKEHLCWSEGPEVWPSMAHVKSPEPEVQAKTYPCIIWWLACSKAPLLGI